ncbi:glycosyltransferase family 4 protein [Almyronema epifaneia]|uniref:Glycosyltransferase family 4 protein n=1 Tax=Almyronema epifaneia S1 TaxID=2991925 RepID=A0ABW6IK38_9CYAN
MKIAIIAHSHYPIKQPFAGGLESHTFHLAQQLQQAGHQVTLFAAAGSETTLPFIPFFQPTATNDSIAEEEIVAYRERRYLSLMRVLKQGNYDLVHNNSLHYIPLKLASALPMPMVTVLHTPPFESLVEGFKSSLTASHHRTIAVSKSAAKSWLNAIPNLKTQLIYNGVDTRLWLPTNQQQKYAIWVGRITPEKGLHLAIKAAQLANMPLKICGPIYDAGYFSQAVQPLLSDQAVYLGNLGMQALARQVAQAQVFVCTPCWDEPFGLVAAEALSCGTPVAGFGRGALVEIVTPETGVLVPEDVEALAQAIAQTQPLSRKHCRQRAVERFSMAAMIQRYTDFYQTLVSDRVPFRTTRLPLVS